MHQVRGQRNRFQLDACLSILRPVNRVRVRTDIELVYGIVERDGIPWLDYSLVARLTDQRIRDDDWEGLRMLCKCWPV